jgi:hypothetical protein
MMLLMGFPPLGVFSTRHPGSALGIALA